MRRRLVLIGAALTVLPATVGCGDTGDESPAGANGPDPAAAKTVYPLEKRPAAPPLEGTLTDDTTFDAGTLAGKVVVVNFWGSWCAPCRAETDDLEAVYGATRKLGVEFLGINLRDDKDSAQAFVRGRVTYPSLFDPAGRLAIQFQHVPASAIPATVLLDRQGGIAVVFRRAIVRAELEPIVAALAAEKG